MEPWHFSHGEPVITLGAAPLARLQWSHGILAMERARGCAPGLTIYGLQWSHGILAMERRDPRQFLRHARRASMEPWHFSHGEHDVLLWKNDSLTSFNGAMAF